MARACRRIKHVIGTRRSSLTKQTCSATPTDQPIGPANAASETAPVDPLARLRISATKTQPRAVASCGLGRALKRDVIAEALKPALQVCDGAGLTDLVEIGFSEVAVRQSFGEHVIGADENLVGNGEGRAHGAAAGLETVEFVFEVAALGPRGGDCGADQDRAEVDIALSGAAALLPAGALVAAGTDAGPGAQVMDA